MVSNFFLLLFTIFCFVFTKHSDVNNLQINKYESLSKKERILFIYPAWIDIYNVQFSRYKFDCLLISHSITKAVPFSSSVIESLVNPVFKTAFPCRYRWAGFPSAGSILNSVFLIGKIHWIFYVYSGSHLPFHIVSNTVLSAVLVFTVVFGMGTGVPLKRIATRYFFRFLFQNTHNWTVSFPFLYSFFLRKEVIQPHLPIRLPCYDFTPVIEPAFDSSSLSVRSLASGIPNSHGVTGGVYKTRERIHRDILIRDY